MPSFNKTKRNSFFENLKNSEEIKAQQNSIKQEATGNKMKIEYINVSDIEFNEGNTIFNELDTEEDIKILADNIEEIGLLEPIWVVRDGIKYKLLSGERRTKAFRYRNWTTIPAFIGNNFDELKQTEILYHANLQTRYMDDKRRFLAFNQLMEVYKKFKTPGVRQKDIDAKLAKMLDVSTRSVERLRQLIKQSNPSDIELLKAGKIDYAEFKKRTVENVIKQQQEVEAQKRLLAKSIVSFNNYVDKRTNTVYSVIQDSDGKYRSCFTNSVSYKLPFSLPTMPQRETKEDAQVDLDVFASNNGCVIYDGDFSEFQSKVVDTPLDKNSSNDEFKDKSTQSEKHILSDEPNKPIVKKEDINEDSHSFKSPETVTVEKNEGLSKQSESDDSNDSVEEIIEETQKTSLQDEHTLSPEIADFIATDSQTGQTVRGSLYVSGSKTFILSNIGFGSTIGKNKYNIIGIATEVIPSTIQRNDLQ